MHSTDGVTEGISFNHNGDMSGDVRITINENATWPFKDEDAVEYAPPNESFGLPGYWTVRIPFDDLKRLVARYIQSERVAALENLDDDDEILGLPRN